VNGFPGAEYVADGLRLLEHECEILIPAALESQITEENAGRIRARIIAEGANGPATYEGDRILRESGKVVIPDMYCNAGGVTVSYFEWIKNLNHIRFGRMERRLMESRAAEAMEAVEKLVERNLPESFGAEHFQEVDELNLVRSGLDDTMREAYGKIREVWCSRDDVPDLRTAAYIVAIAKVARYYTEYALY
jgi:glutamate dehydrogenase (NAD(P)+)